MESTQPTPSPRTPAPLACTPVPALQDNYIWILDDGAQAIVVDPGEAAPAIAMLRERKLALAAILLTHHHGDHVGGVAALREACNPAAPVYGPADERIASVTDAVRGSDTVAIAALGVRFAVIDTPGHTLGHIAYYSADEVLGAPCLFCGDTLFASGCGRLFEGTPAQMLASLDALAALPEATRVCCAHEYTLSNIRFAQACEPDNTALAAWAAAAQALRAAQRPTLPTTLAHERACNPFLRLDAPTLQASVAHQAGREPGSRESRFAVLRAWKDVF